MESWELEAQFQEKLNELQAYFEAEIAQIWREMKFSSKRSKGLTVEEMVDKLDSNLTFSYMGDGPVVRLTSNPQSWHYSVESKHRDGVTFFNYVGTLCTEIRNGETRIPTSRQIKEAIDKYAMLLRSRYHRGQLTDKTR